MLRVLTLNLYFGRADVEVIVARVREVGADVLFLQELNADAVTRLKEAGLDDLMPLRCSTSRAAIGWLGDLFPVSA